MILYKVIKTFLFDIRGHVEYSRNFEVEGEQMITEID
jgi:hypothetical protein